MYPTISSQKVCEAQTEFNTKAPRLRQLQVHQGQVGRSKQMVFSSLIRFAVFGGKRRGGTDRQDSWALYLRPPPPPCCIFGFCSLLLLRCLRPSGVAFLFLPNALGGHKGRQMVNPEGAGNGERRGRKGGGKERRNQLHLMAFSLPLFARLHLGNHLSLHQNRVEPEDPCQNALQRQPQGKGGKDIKRGGGRGAFEATGMAHNGPTDT